MKAYNFSLKEFFVDCDKLEIKYAMNNSVVVNNLFRLVQMMSVVRWWLQSPIIITSGYRDVNHNKRVAGSSTSQHIFGQACDFKIRGDRKLLLDFLYNSVGYGQLIIYPTFFHISIPTPKISKQTLVELPDGRFRQIDSYAELKAYI